MLVYSSSLDKDFYNTQFYAFQLKYMSKGEETNIRGGKWVGSGQVRVGSVSGQPV